MIRVLHAQIQHLLYLKRCQMFDSNVINPEEEKMDPLREALKEEEIVFQTRFQHQCGKVGFESRTCFANFKVEGRC